MIMNPQPRRIIMLHFADIENPFGAQAFVAPTSTKVRPHKLPKVKKGTVVRRDPKPLSTVVKNFLLTYNG
jgi:uncharacterized linocin/CFP29 family protein